MPDATSSPHKRARFTPLAHSTSKQAPVTSHHPPPRLKIVHKPDVLAFLMNPPMEVALFILFAIFSFWLMFHTFSYDPTTHAIRIAFKIWSDFGAHIPLIRSFSMGKNWPPEYPIYPGEPIRYHFLFDLFVGLLEKIGIRIDWALNIPSIIGFYALLSSLYLLAYRLTKKRSVALLTVIFFLYNGSLGFIKFFIDHPLSIHSVSDIVHANAFPAFAPWGPGDITAFWNLNIYTNQRHLAAAFACVIFFLLTIYHIDEKPLERQLPFAVIWGLLLGLLPYFHQPTLLIFAVCMTWYFFAFPRARKFLYCMGIVGAALVIPQLTGVLHTGAKAMEWYPGFIIHNELAAQHPVDAILHFLYFWWQNFGGHSVFILVGFFLLPKKAQKLLFPIFPLFIIANVAKFSVEASANHKFFNFILMVGQIASGYMLMTLYADMKRRARHWMVDIAGGVVVGFLILLLTLSGIIDFFVIANDTQGSVTDIPANEAATWIARNTPGDSIFLNSSYLYHPASIAGRKIFLGWPYFAWSAGYPIDRMPIMKTMYESRSSSQLCSMLHDYHISYITVEDVKNDVNLPKISLSYFVTTYKPVFVSRDKRYAIITTQSVCAHRP